MKILIQSGKIEWILIPTLYYQNILHIIDKKRGGFLKKHLKEFGTFPDVTVMLLILFVCAFLTIPHLLHPWTWVALAAGMLTYATSEYIVHRFLFHICCG